MKAVIYLRKSRADAEAEQRGEGETLARHERILLEVAKRQNLNVEKIYKEIVSGETIASRPVMQQLLSEVEQGLWEGVIVVEVERLARGDTIDQGIMAQAFKYSGTKIITPTKTYDPTNQYDEEFFEFSLFMSRREYKTINRRLQQGRISSCKEGKYVGNKPPYGYIRQPLDKQKGFTLIPHPEQAPIVKMIFDLYVFGDNGKRIGVSLIVRKLNEMGIPAQKGEWTNSTIQTILRNPVYAGKIRWNSRPQIKKVVDGQIKKERPRRKQDEWILVDGLHEPIIDADTFEQANIYINTNRPNPNPSQCQTMNPLAGIVVCGICNRKMVRRPYNQKEQPDSLICAQTSCNNKSSALHLVEAEILKALEGWVSNYQAQLNQEDCIIDTGILEKNIKSLEDEIVMLKKQMNSTYDLLERKIYDTETFLTRSKVINDRIKEAEEQKENISKQIETILQQREAKEKIIPKVNSVINSYHEAEDPALKNSLLKQVLDKVIYFKSQKSTKKNPLGDMTLEFFPII